MIKKRKRFFSAFDEFGPNPSESPILKEREEKLKANLFKREAELRQALEKKGMIPKPKEKK